MTGSRGAHGPIRWSALLAAVLIAVPLLVAGASSAAPAAGSAVTVFPVTTFPYDITGGPDGALWFTNSSGADDGSIGRISTAGVVTTYTDPTIKSPASITAGSDGALWFTNVRASDNSIGRITTAGQVTNFKDPRVTNLGSITSGPDGALWFATGGDINARKPASIGRLTTSGALSVFSDPMMVFPADLTAGPDGAVWFVNFGTVLAPSIGRITTDGIVTLYSDPAIGQPGDLTAGPDGALWFTDTGTGNGAIGRISTAGVVTKYNDPGIFRPSGITAGPDGALWFADSDAIGRITTAGAITITNSLNAKLNFVSITAGSDGALWLTSFGDASGGLIGRITTGLTPAAPLVPSASASSGQATVRWTTPASNGSAPITGYKVVPFIGDLAQTPKVFTGTATTQTVTGLTNGKTYQFRIAAVNAAGIGALSGFSYPVTVGPPSPWKVVPSPTPSGAFSSGVLNAVTCTSSKNCLAVGTGSASGAAKPLAEHWNGTAWSIVKTGSPKSGGGTLTAVSCATATTCFAVGETFNDQMLIERWDGTRFAIVGPSVFGRFNGVSCPSATRCFAVGDRVNPLQALVERWDGTKWSAVTDAVVTAKQSRFNAVSCVSATSCLAIGTTVVRWDGTRWSQVASPDPAKFPAASLASLSCKSATSCFATGGLSSSQLGLTGAARWNGTRWSSTALPVPDDFVAIEVYGLSCASATSCVAVGSRDLATAGGDTKAGGTLIEQWNGTRWAVVGSVSPGGLGVLYGVWCTNTVHCVAVGTGGHATTLIERS